MAQLRLGMIGTGKFAARHLGLLAETDPDVTVVAHLGRHADNATAAAARFGGKAYADLDSFISEGRPDAVIMTVPPAAHGATELALAKARIPFLVEKPVGLDLTTIGTIAEAIDRAGMPVAIGFNWRAADFLPALREELLLHTPRMLMGRWHGGTPDTPWWRMEALSGGQFVEQAIHIVDLARALVGDAELLGATGSRAPLPDYADGDVSGAGAALVRFRTGAPGVFTATCLLPNMGGADLTLIADKAQIVVRQHGFTVEADGETIEHKAEESAYVRQNRAFFAAVRSGNATGLFCTYADGLGTHALCLGIRDAIAAQA
ncbi:MAG TPA: Gfo/Idh/MocA family oxidoreductase [Devosiaceae bacterium]|jgi:predicted dehydrogenase